MLPMFDAETIKKYIFCKKDNIYKDFNVKVSINLTSVQIDEIFC